MKKVLLAAIAFIISAQLFAQAPAASGANKGRQMPAIGHIYGKVVDSLGKPLGDATIVLLQNKYDSTTKKTKQLLFKGATTEANGDFDFSELPFFGITMKISAVGYKTYEEKINFQPKAPSGSTPGQGNQAQQMGNMMSAMDKDLGNIKMEQDAQTLDAVHQRGVTRGEGAPGRVAACSGLSTGSFSSGRVWSGASSPRTSWRRS